MFWLETGQHGLYIPFQTKCAANFAASVWSVLEFLSGGKKVIKVHVGRMMFWEV